jgi:hypothetical protein
LFAAVVIAVIGLSWARAQGGPDVVLRGNGQILLKDAEGDFGTLELNLHNSNWKYASQTEATAEAEEQPGGGQVFTGALTVPDVPGAAISFLQTLNPTEMGLQIIYELRPSGPMILNGLQISLLLPTERFGGQKLIVGGGEAADRTVELPRVLNPAQWQLGTFQGKSVQIGDAAAPTCTLTLDKGYPLIVQDLRQWERDEFEIRLPFIQADQGKAVGDTDRFDVEITLGPGPVALSGP